MHEKIVGILQHNGLDLPPQEMGDDLYGWLEAARRICHCSFISCSSLSQEDVSALKSSLGDVPQDLRFYYSRSTPWDYGKEEYFDRMTRIRTDCVSLLVNNSSMSEKEASEKFFKDKPLWPVKIYGWTPGSTLAFCDDFGRLAIVSADLWAGFGLGRPLAIGLRNYFVWQVVSELMFFEGVDDEVDDDEEEEVVVDENEGEDEESMVDVSLRPEVLSVAEWPSKEAPQHILIDCFRLRETSHGDKRKGTGK